ncbi:hypothetical protein GCM10011415_42250 [Salipiger pallidus]|uniref:Uncharacterized protein n=1 Tax=Salipiger pallidus TaxID=1775170 RepID=A0A8J2ZNH1_9RHOB|nr:hypothetical protein [Salipiger pallidus]GGG87266.1 hypothetical protein GCM10011415_42250 [Salipiger pallidus]
MKQLFLPLLLVLSACVTPPEALDRASRSQRDALTFAITRLGPLVKLSEARRLADLAYDYPVQIARRQAGTDPPLRVTRNIRLGYKTPGFCYTWADALYARLRQEGFRTIGVAVAMSPVRLNRPIERSGVAVTLPGRPVSSGLILDACSEDGALVWSKAEKGLFTSWQPRDSVLWEKRFGRKPWYALNPGSALIQRAREF